LFLEYIDTILAVIINTQVYFYKIYKLAVLLLA